MEDVYNMIILFMCHRGVQIDKRIACNNTATYWHIHTCLPYIYNTSCNGCWKWDTNIQVILNDIIWRLFISMHIITM